MSSHHTDRFERGIIQVVTILGLVRFAIALFVNKPEVDGYPDLYLDIVSLTVFVGGFLLVHFNARNRWLITFFFIPLMILMWLSMYFHKGIASSTEVNAFALVIILSLTSKGKLPLIFVLIYLAGLGIVLHFVESVNLAYLAPSDYYENTFTLLFVSLAIIWMTTHAKSVFNARRNELKLTNDRLKERKEEVQRKNEVLTKQNSQLDQVRKDLEEKVLLRTEELRKQKSSIEEYMKLTLNELIAPYNRTISAIKGLESPPDDQIKEMIIQAGNNLESEVEKLKARLRQSND